MKVRIVKDSGGFRVQLKRRYWPFWINDNWFITEPSALEHAKQLVNPESAVVWSSDATR